MRASSALALVGAAAALVLGEGVARLHGDRLCVETPGAVYQADPRVGWLHVPHLAGWVARCGPQEPAAPVDIDAHGLRAAERRPGAARVLVLGGDLPEGFGVPAHATLDHLLELRADRRRGVRLEVVNAGVGGFALDNDLLYLRSDGGRLGSDRTVVIIDAGREVDALSPFLAGAAGRPVRAKRFFTLDGGRLVPEPELAVAERPEPARGLLEHAQLVRLATHQPSRHGPPVGWRAPAPVVDASAERRRALALARALLAALRDETGGRLAAAVAPARAVGRDDAEPLIAMLAELGIPAVDLGPAFARFAASTGRTGYFPGSDHWTSDGHFVAAEAIWRLLLTEGLLPAGVVPARVLGGGRPRGRLALSPRALAARAWRLRHSITARFVLGGLLCVTLLWAGAFLPARARDWLLVALSLGLVAALGTPALALLVLAYALAFHTAVERLPGPAAAVAIGVLLAALVVAPVLWLPRWLPGYAGSVGKYFGLATNVALLRFTAYGYDRRLGGAPRRPLREFLGAMFFFPTFVNGPIESLEEFRAGRVAGGVAPASLGAHLRAAARALGRLGWGAVKIDAARRFVATMNFDVFATGGDVFGHARLWLWTLELYAYFYLTFSGWTDLAIALGRMSGSTVAENFRAPWAASDVADFWHRWHVTLGRWLRAYVYIPLGGNRRHVYLNILAVFLVSALWHVWGALKILGPAGYPPAAWSGFLLWGLMNAAGVMLAHYRRRRFWVVAPGEAPGAVTAVGEAGLLWRRAATGVFVALCWVPFFLPPWNRMRDCVAVFARLAFVSSVRPW